MPELLKLTLILLIVCFVSAAALSKTYESTKEQIMENRAATEADARLAVLPGAEKIVKAKELSLDKEIPVFKGLDQNDEIVGYAFKVSQKGFSGGIDIMIGARRGDEGLVISGTRVLRHSETPGLGAEMTTRSYNEKLGAAEKVPTFQKQFIGEEASNLFLVKSGKGTIESITAATVSSKAFTEAVREGLKELSTKLSGRTR